MEKILSKELEEATLEYLSTILSTTLESQKHTMEYNDLAKIFQAGAKWVLNHSKEKERKKIIEDFSRSVCNIEDCPAEFIDIVNNKFWEII